MKARQIQLIILLHHFLFIVFLFMGEFHSIDLLVFFLGWIFIAKIGGEIGLHRYFAHRSFKVNGFFHLLLCLAATLCCFGSPLGWSLTHLSHHRHADTKKDPHGKLVWYRIWLTDWRMVKSNPSDLRLFSNDSVLKFIHRNYFKILIPFFLVAYLVSFSFSVVFFSLPIIVMFHSAALVNIICHRFGYRRFETKDHSYNNLLVNFLTLGSGLHNSHHAKPGAWSLSEKWYEVDLHSMIIRLIKI